MRERSWLIPSTVMTVISAATALLLIPNYTGLMPALLILPAWLVAAALIASVTAFAGMCARRVESPFAEVRRLIGEDRQRVARIGLIVLLAGLNMIAFMWVKPLLNYLVPFWADPLLAKVDYTLFLGHDPSALLGWLNFPAAGLIYHQAWFAGMILALLLAASAPHSPERSAVLLSYFVLWSIVGPLIHSLLPAAGPIFYERLGYGERFGTLDGGTETEMVADYLWNIYAAKSFGAGSGISAMPSMHVTMSAWIVIAARTLSPRKTWLAIAAWLVIFALSISLGWHYAMDGIVGTLAAVAMFKSLLFILRAQRDIVSQATPVSA